RHLQKQGVGPEVLVAICLERSTEMLVGLLGIMKAGGAYVPLDPIYPEQRLAFIMLDSQAAVLVTDERSGRWCNAAGVCLVRMDADWEVISREADQNFECDLVPANLAYVIYTSGSTGTPKGVAVQHSSVANLFETTKPLFGFDASDVWTTVHSYSFDFSVWE